MSVPPPSPDQRAPWLQQPARPIHPVLALLHRFLTPMTVAIASAVLWLLSLVSLFLAWAHGRQILDDSPYHGAVANGFGHVTASNGTRTRAGYLIIALLLLVLLAAAVAAIALTRNQRLAAVLLTAGGVLEIVYAIVGMAAGMGKAHGFGLVRSKSFDSYFWHVSYHASTGGGAVLALILGIITAALGAGYFLARPHAATTPMATLTSIFRTRR